MAKDDKPEKAESVGFLTGIDAKLAALQELRESYMRAVSVGAIGDIDFGALGTVANPGRTADQPIDLPTGAFLNKSMPEAIKLLYLATKRKYTPKEVTAALKDGGFESTARSFERTVTGTMYRMKDQGVLLKFKDGFGLAELYPEHLRARIAKDSKATAKTRKQGKHAAKRRKPSAKAAVKRTTTAKRPKRRTTNDGPSIDDLILKILTVEGPNSPAAFVARLVKPANIVGLALGRLAKLGKAKKLPNGNYAAVTTEPVLRAV